MKNKRVSSICAAVSLLVAGPVLAEPLAKQLPQTIQGKIQLAQNGSVPPGALMRWCATVPDRFRTAVFERRCARLRQASRGRLREWCNRMPPHWQSRRMQQRCSFIVGRRPVRRGGDDGTGIDEGGAAFGVGRCNVRRVTLVVRSRGCTGQRRRLNFRKSYLRPGESLVGRVETGVIGKGYAPYGVCNFKTRLKYRCVRGRVRITAVYECRQGKSGPRGANCSLSY